MRPRTEAALGAAALCALVLFAAVSGRRQRNAGNEDTRASSLLNGPRGLKGMADVIARSGRTVVRWRGGTTSPFERAPARSLVVVADPVVEFSPNEITSFFSRTGDALLAGLGSEPLMRCVGFDVSTRVFDSTRVRLPEAQRDGGTGGQGNWAWAHAALRDVPVAQRTMPNPAEFGDPIPCPTVSIASIDTLLQDDRRRPVMLRVQRADRRGSLVLLADVALLSNAVLRASPLAPDVLAHVLGASRTVIFDEMHQGFGVGGSLAGVVLAWSRTTPVGWMLWQVVVVGVLAFLAGAARFGAVTEAIPRARRSSREHVRALATALAAAKGHDVAIGAIVRGLRRRLQGSGRASGGVSGDWRDWVASLGDRAATRREREQVQRLLNLTRPNQSNAAVRSAANVVEDVWEALHH